MNERMSGLIFVVYKEEFRVAHMIPDHAHPVPFGANIVRFLREEFDKERFIENLANIHLYGADETMEDIFDIEPEKVLSFIQHAHISSQTPPEVDLLNSTWFATFSKRCRWAYVVDLDKDTFEVFRGQNKEELDADERFASLESFNHPDWQAGWRPVRHTTTWNLSDLPKTNKELLDGAHRAIKIQRAADELAGSAIKTWMESGRVWF